jgi:hypothetical protein
MSRKMLGRIGRMTVGLLSVGLLSETPVEATWRIDIEGGAFVPGSSVTIGNGGEGDQTEVSTDFNVGGSVAVGGGYSLNDYVELGGQFQSRHRHRHRVRYLQRVVAHLWATAICAPQHVPCSPVGGRADRLVSRPR